MYLMQGQIPYSEMSFGEILQDGLFLKKGDIIAFLDSVEYDKWFKSGNGKILKWINFEEVQKRYGRDFVVLMSNDARCDRHVMRRFDAEKFVNYYSNDYGNKVTFYKSVYQVRPTNFY